MEQYFTKNASIEEIKNLRYLDALGVKLIIPEHILKGNDIVYRKETVLPVAAMFDVKYFSKICEDILINIYKIKSKYFSSGIYSYINKEYPLKRKVKTKYTYTQYLRIEFINIVQKYRMLKTNNNEQKFIHDYYEYVVKQLLEYDKYEACEFCLLHGDFHLGNIIFSENDGIFKMIDFEYLRFGMPELEIANFIVQLLDGGEYVEPFFKKYISWILNETDKLYKIDKKIICSLFIPMLIFFRVWRSIDAVNEKQLLVKGAVLNVAEKCMKGNYDECIISDSTI